MKNHTEILHKLKRKVEDEEIKHKGILSMLKRKVEEAEDEHGKFAKEIHNSTIDLLYAAGMDDLKGGFGKSSIAEEYSFSFEIREDVNLYFTLRGRYIKLVANNYEESSSKVMDRRWDNLSKFKNEFIPLLKKELL